MSFNPKDSRDCWSVLMDLYDIPRENLIQFEKQLDEELMNPHAGMRRRKGLALKIVRAMIEFHKHL